MTLSAAISSETFIDRLLAEERELTAVERFSRLHDRGELHSRQARYRSLLPVHAPKAGEQYAFEVDLDQCSGCKACVTACHAMNGLDENETWRGVGLISNPESTQRHVTSACHHCADPGCLNGCPVLAYDKDPTTGIVRHLDDQCIGCQYCIMMCPYEVPKYSHRLGIVRKCDMCSQRLEVGEPPACAQACPNQAIRISTLSTARLADAFRSGSDRARSHSFLPDSPPPDITLPSTQFKSSLTFDSSWKAADAASRLPADIHFPLVFMLVLSQFSVGILLCGGWQPGSVGLNSILISLTTLVVSLLAGTAHLGQPLRAWRVFLGWRKSWLSREMLAFGAFSGALSALAASTALPISNLGANRWPLLMASTAAGLAGVFASAKIYAETRRPFWNLTSTLTRFASTTVLLGATTMCVLDQAAKADRPALWFVLAMGIALIKALLEWSAWSAKSSTADDLLACSGQLLRGPLRSTGWLRLLAATTGLALLGASLAVPNSGWKQAMGTLAIVLLLLGECLERVLFFRAVAPFKMPGGVAA